ncbi:metallophosphoesterase [Bacteroides sp. 224]|uniref:metallophosphoesterase n=1 Tax=Bacteroides sp. 224 TaxID=2302936 RepID=UPI0013D66180|nr:metallophosphoesterase [Bacteroides sp. 224]NDV65384.1 acid phosphatase [Bacteroides sp. 224]
MKKTLIFLFSLISSLASAQIKITHGPYLCDMTTDGVTVVWTTNKPALSWVEMAPDDGKSFYSTEQPKYFETVAGRKQAHKTLHRIRLSNLNPATNYRYRIFSREVLNWNAGNNVQYGQTASSNVYSKKPFLFKTYPDSNERVSFLVMNDIHGRAAFMKDLCKDVDFKQFAFVCMNGDMANFIESEEQIFKDFIDASVDMYASETPILFARGNHETRGVFSDSLIDYFPTQDGKTYQHYKVGTVSILVLDGGEDKPDSDIEYNGLAHYDAYRAEEAKWLEKVVQTDDFKNASARIVFLHIPPYGDWHGNVQLKKHFVPILNKAGIDVMFSGHTHRYSFHPKNEEVQFPVVVNGNKSYVRCDIDNNKIRVEVVGEDGKSVQTLHIN